MTLESHKIRREIKHILDDEGKLRSRELVENVCKSAKVSPKPVYREIQYLTQSNEIKKIENNRANIEYESIDYEKDVSQYINYFEQKLLEFDKKIKDWHDNFLKKRYLEQMFALRPLLKVIQNLDAEYSLIQETNLVQNSKKFKEIKKLIDKSWMDALGSLHITKNKKALNELLMTLRYESVNAYRNYENFKKSPLIPSEHGPA